MNVNDLLIMLLSIWGVPKREALYRYSLLQLGKDLSTDADNDVACAESVTRIVHSIFPTFIPVTVSTYSLYQSLRKSARFIQVDKLKALPGDIVISPTGYGTNPEMPNGHVGILSSNGVIMSNNSKTGLWATDFTMASWYERYVIRGGYPMLFFRVLA